MSTPQRSKLLLSLRRWKAKAIARRHENKALKKSLRWAMQEIEISRIKQPNVSFSGRCGVCRESLKLYSGGIVAGHADDCEYAKALKLLEES